MPQLNPSPWLMIFSLIWTFFLFIFLNKTLNLTCPNMPLMKELKKVPLSPWNWPWF